MLGVLLGDWVLDADGVVRTPEGDGVTGCGDVDPDAELLEDDVTVTGCGDVVWLALGLALLLAIWELDACEVCDALTVPLAGTVTTDDCSGDSDGEGLQVDEAGVALALRVGAREVDGVTLPLHGPYML